MRGIVFTQDSGDGLIAGRTRRMLLGAGIESIETIAFRELPARLAVVDEPVWLVRAGAWQMESRTLRTIPPSATGRGLLGVGSGPSCFAEVSAARALAEVLARGRDFASAITILRRERGIRAVPLHDVDVRFHPDPRCLQVITTIQMGGAERIALDLAEEFNRMGWRTAVAALGAPTRRSYPQPPYFFDLSGSGFAPENRADAVQRAALSFGVDVVHAHLIRASEASAIRARGLPLAISLHNILPSWPAGYAEAREPFADRYLGCAVAVTQQFAARVPAAKVRTVWNGIDPERVTPRAERMKAGKALREQLLWDPSDFVLLAVANPRPQKRLHRLPEIVALVEDLIAPRRVRLLLAGEPAAGNAEAAMSVAKFEREVETWHLRKSIHWTGPVDDVAPLLAAADCFIAVSELEGLSLAQLEALAAGLPVVATAVGGTAEAAARSARLSILPRDAAAEAFATVVATVAYAPPPRVPGLPPDFTRERMALRTRMVLLGLLATTEPSRAEAVWLVINNFATGGAQSSARRLLLGLRERGAHVRAATLEEWPEKRMAGSAALMAAGIDVAAIHPSREADRMVAELLAAFAIDRPKVIFFWNVIPAVKVLLAEVLANVPIVDVSPGEMYFQSFDRFFAKRPAGCTMEGTLEYGSRLAAAVVKYKAESKRASAALGAPVHVIRNGIVVREDSGKRRRRKVLTLGTVARLSPDKRLDQLLAAFRIALPRMPRCRLLIAGGPESRAPEHPRELREQARGLPVEWRGDVRDVAGFLDELDLFAMVSEPAGCPNASLEAMASGLAVVATDHGGAAEQVIGGVTGLLVPRGDVHGFAEALVLLAQDDALREAFGRAGRERIRDEFSLVRMVDQYAALIESIEEWEKMGRTGEVGAPICLHRSLSAGTRDSHDAR